MDIHNIHTIYTLPTTVLVKVLTANLDGMRANIEEEMILAMKYYSIKCHQIGHMVKLPMNRSKGSSCVIEEDGIALIHSNNCTNEWFIDSAPAKHMTQDKSLLVNHAA